jgi:hypothetical protein
MKNDDNKNTRDSKSTTDDEPVTGLKISINIDPALLDYFAEGEVAHMVNNMANCQTYLKFVCEKRAAIIKRVLEAYLPGTDNDRFIMKLAAKITAEIMRAERGAQMPDTCPTKPTGS